MFLDESIDVTSTVSCIHIWEGSAEFEVTEELASMNSKEQIGENISK